MTRAVAGSSNPVVVILDPLEIVLPEIITGLNFDKDHVFCSWVFGLDARPVAGYRPPDPPQTESFIISVNYRQTLDDKPVFSPMPMALKTQALTGIDNNPFDLVIRFVREHPVISHGRWSSR